MSKDIIIAALDIKTTSQLTFDYLMIEIYISLWKDKKRI